MLSSSKSPSGADNVPNKKKRKVLSPLGSKSPKVIKLGTKENSVRSIHEKEGEDTNERKLNSSNDSVEIISDDEKKNLEQSDEQKMCKGDNTPKRKSKNKKLDRSQQKSGALTKFLKKTDRQIEESDISHNNLSELKDKKDDQSTTVHKGKNDVCSDESLDVSFNSSELQDTIQTQLNETDEGVASKNADLSLQESDCDITILSSDNEASSELDKSLSNISKETPDKSAIPVTPKTNKEMINKIKKLTPKQLEKKQEIAKRKEEKLKLKMVNIYRKDLKLILFIYKKFINLIILYIYSFNYILFY